MVVVSGNGREMGRRKMSKGQGRLAPSNIYIVDHERYPKPVSIDRDRLESVNGQLMAADGLTSEPTESR